MTSETSGHLRRVLGVGFGLAVSIGGTIGVGILRTPGLVAGQLHVPSLIVFLWLAGGIYTLLGASCLTELGLMLPRAGGFYVYVRRLLATQRDLPLDGLTGSCTVQSSDICL